MTTDIIPLGTSAAIPTRHRHLSGLALRRPEGVLLFDCGEGTQFQLIRAGVKRSRIDAVFITHLHGDHYFGLMGLLSTLVLLTRTRPVTVVGPEGIANLVRAMPGLADHALPFPIEYVELPEGIDHAVVVETDAYRIEARSLEHRVFSLGYRFQEKDRPGHLYPERARALGVTNYRHFRRLKAGEAVTLEDGRVVEPEEVVGPPQRGSAFAYVGDTRPCEAGVMLARDVGLLYHEATFGDDLRARAVATGHSTAREAAGVARRAGARQLLLGHFSARYTDADVLVAEARTVFPDTEAAEELKPYVLATDGTRPGN
ncbi:MAG: ribonuclease Z [Rhodothermales bacterium]